MMSLRYGVISWGDQKSTWWQLDFVGFLLLWKKLWLIWLKSWYIPSMGFYFQLAEAQPALLPEGIWSMYIESPSIFLDQRSFFKAMEVWQWAQGHGIHWSCQILHHPVVADWMVSWRYKRGANLLIIPGVDKYHPIGCNIQLNKWLLWGVLALICGLHKSGNQEVEI